MGVDNYRNMLKEAIRVTQSGATIGLTTWGRPNHFNNFAVLGKVFGMYGLGPKTPPTKTPFDLSTETLKLLKKRCNNSVSLTFTCGTSLPTSHGKMQTNSAIQCATLMLYKQHSRPFRRKRSFNSRLTWKLVSLGINSFLYGGNGHNSNQGMTDYDILNFSYDLSLSLQADSIENFTSLATEY